MNPRKLTLCITMFALLIAGASAVTQANHKTYGKVYKTTTDTFFDKAVVGPYTVDTTGKFVITVTWEAKKNSLFSGNKVDVRLEAFQKAGGDTVLKTAQKRNADKEDQLKTEFRFTSAMKDNAKTVYFRVYEFCGDGDPNTVNPCPSNQDHTIEYAIRVEWKPDH